MATAQIILSQAPGGTRPAGEDVADGAVGNLVTVTATPDAAIDSWTLELFSRPKGPEADSTSAVSLGVFAAGNTPAVLGTFTPDAFGAFMIELVVVGTDGSITTDVACFGCPTELGSFKPGFKQSVLSSKFGGQLFGWTYNTDRIQRDARLARLKTQVLNQDRPLSVGMQSTGSTSFEVIGGQQFTPSDFVSGSGGIVRTIQFRAVIYASPGMTAQVRIFNWTDGAQVASSVLSSASNTPVVVQATLTSPGDLPTTEKLYLAELRISAGAPAPSDRAFCLSSIIKTKLEG